MFFIHQVGDDAPIPLDSGPGMLFMQPGVGPLPGFMIFAVADGDKMYVNFQSSSECDIAIDFHPKGVQTVSTVLVL